MLALNTKLQATIIETVTAMQTHDWCIVCKGRV